LQEQKPWFAFRLNLFNVVGDGCPVRQPSAANMSAVDMKLTERQEDLALKNFSHGHCTVDFWRQVPESKFQN